jgi:hypothetical protein
MIRCPNPTTDGTTSELVGTFANGGRETQPAGEPELVNVHDFPDPKGQGDSYGVDDLGRSTGWASVGTGHDTAAFAVATLRRWWEQVGQRTYPAADRLLVTADAGGSNGYRVRAWKLELASSPRRPSFRSPSATCRQGSPSGTGSSSAVQCDLDELARPAAGEP